MQSTLLDPSEAYEGSQQFWRYLGVFIDCSVDSDRQEEQQDELPCRRKLLWAAYVRPQDSSNYQVAVGEDSWDTSRCDEGSECFKLDCHEPRTKFALLGVFKQPYFASEFMEQLFKHMGYCLWDSQTYSFMTSNYASIPEGCVQTEQYDSQGNPLYLALQPGVEMQYGLYTDESCLNLHPSDSATIERTAQSLGLTQNLSRWNGNLRTFQACQPCIAYSLGNEDFSCTDDAGYTNVNQCMKMRTQTTLELASWEDMQAADQQNAIFSVTIGHQTFGRTSARSARSLSASKLWTTNIGAVIAAGFLFSVVRWQQRRRLARQRDYRRLLSKPLVQRSP